MHRLQRWLVPAALVGLLGYRSNTDSAAAPAHVPTPAVTAAVAAALPPPAYVPSCAERIAAVLDAPGLAGTPGLHAARGQILLHAKAEPVHFSEPPSRDPEISRSARSYRSMLHRTQSPWSVLQRLSSMFAANAELGRQVLLTDGYLYAEEPKLAFALSDLVSAQLLFNEKQIWIQRGERLLHAERTRNGGYAFTAGPERGERVRLMLFDRIGAGPPPPALHRDFRALRQRLGFDRAKVVHESREALVADLRYGTFTVRSLMQAEDAHLELACELAGDHAPALANHRQHWATQTTLLDPLRQAMAAAVDEGLPFDEPLTEYGQQDGQLRPAWQRAYLAGNTFYELNDDRYYVFDRAGRPKVPQVCIDFIYDTFERASGNWWRGRGQAPGRTPGKLDFSTLTSLNLRRANSIVDLTRSVPDSFQLHSLPETERIPFKHGAQLVAYLMEHADDYVPGDIVVIRGYAPWDKPWLPRVMHQHAFFIYESDPITGMPIVLAGNPGQPVLQTWQFEAFRTPERSIQYRVRPSSSWLAQYIKASVGQPPPARLSFDTQIAVPLLDIPTPPGVVTPASASE